MKFNNITPVAAAVAIAVSSMLATPEIAQAEVSTSVGMSNFYLWRGIDSSGGNAQVFGDLKYSHASGAYVGAWLSNAAGTNENNYYLGYSMKAGTVDLDISYWNIVTPTDNAGGESIFDDNAEEVVIGAGFGDFSGTLVVDVDSDHDSKNNYASFGYSMDKYSILVGQWLGDKDKGGMTFGHVTLGYAVTDEVTFSLNQAYGGEADEANKKLLANVAYTKSFEVK